MDSVKDFVSPKRFSISSYICVILHSICGVILIATTTALRLGETEKFNCAVDTTFATHKTYVEKTCFSIYNDVYNSPVRLFAFVLLSFGSVAVVSVIYSLAVASRIDETEGYSSGKDSPRLDGPNQSGTRTLYVFYFYYFHLVVRTIFGMLFTILHFTVLYPTGFDSKFACIYPKLTQPDPNITTAKNASVPSSSVKCENLAAKDKLSCSYAVFGCNVIFTLIMLLEVIYMIRSLTKRGRFPYFKPKSWSCDLEFIIKYFLRKPHMLEEMPMAVEIMPMAEVAMPMDEETMPVAEEAMPIGVDTPALNSAQIYKEKILNTPLTSDINYGLDTDTSLDDIFIDVVIQTEQAPLKFSKDMTRHEINDVYMKVPEHSIRLEEVKDLFHPNEDTKGNSPQTILALGRPGIGKTILTRKLMQDWAKEIDSFYLGKIAFFFKFRWFHFEQLQNVTLKKFLQLGTELSESEFECIFVEIWANPQNGIFIFDGLDEFGGNLEKFQNFFDQSRMSPDDPTCPMSAMYLFIKILSGQILSDATVLVTSRPTANDVLSKLHFDRKVEIIGFTEEKIENYVEKFCANHGKSELQSKIWKPIKSSELKNLCYIPVNCFIVCVTLLNCIGDEGNDNALPTTLTELYQAALVYFHKNHDRNETKESKKVISDLQELGFNGMENGKLIFDGEFVNEQMEESGLLHCLPVPIFQIQPQVCFIHLTVQEFLAAKHIMETKEPKDIKEFISSHVKDGKWHLVLQFLAGLLGKKMGMSKEYRSCILAFGEYLCPDIEGEHIDCNMEPFELMLMKCVRETKSESIAREIAVTSPFKRVTKIVSDDHMLSPSDWAAIVFACKHLNFLTDLILINITNLDCMLEIANLFRHRCIESLDISVLSVSRVEVALEHLFSAITTSQCRIIHEHSKLERLVLDSDIFNDFSASTWAEFCKNGPGICLKVLHLRGNGSSFFGMSEFFKVLGDEGFNQLSVLNLGDNAIDDDNMRILCNTLREKQHGLKEFHLYDCVLTAKCTFWLGQLLSDKHCMITHLVLRGNVKLGDEGVRELCNGFGQGQCKLDVLDISGCSITDECMPDLSKVLGDKMCRLTNLLICGNRKIGNEGVGMLFNALRVKQCSLTKLDLSWCSLTKECMTSLCEALGDEHCRLTKLCLCDNNIGDEGVEMLFNALRVKQCSLTKLDLSWCSLTKECMTSLCEALGDEHCRLTKLCLSYNDIGDEGVEMLCCALVKEQCKLTSLDLLNCSLTDKCIPSLCKAVENVSCRVTELFQIVLESVSYFRNEFTSEGVKLLDEVKTSKQSTAVNLGNYI